MKFLNEGFKTRHWRININSLLGAIWLLVYISCARAPPSLCHAFLPIYFSFKLSFFVPFLFFIFSKELNTQTLILYVYHHWYFKLKLLNITEFIVYISKLYDIRLRRWKIKKIEFVQFFLHLKTLYIFLYRLSSYFLYYLWNLMLS